MTGDRYRDLAARMADGPLAVPTPQPSETCDPQPITEAPFALPTEQPSPYSEGTMLGRLLTDAERERLRDAEETVRRLTAERDALRAAAAFDLVASRDALRCIRELEAELARLRELEAELVRLREVEAAALAFVSAVTAPEVVVLTCRYCDHVATMVRFPGGAARCDRHANGGTDLPYAPAWRRLRKAVGR